MSIITKILNWIVSVILAIYNSPLAKEMAMNVLDIATNQFADAAEFIAQKVREANELPLTSKEKYDWVVVEVKKKFATIPGSTLNQLIEAALALLNKEKEAKIAELIKVQEGK